MNSDIVFDNKNILTMKLLHYFITEKNYNPIILQGVDNEIWLENLNEECEVIRIVSHSMGGAYAKGYAQALMEYILEHPDLTNGASLVEYDFAPCF